MKHSKEIQMTDKQNLLRRLGEQTSNGGGVLVGVASETTKKYFV